MTKTVNASHYSNYEYDALGRMTKEWMCNNVVITKSYDNNGNLLTQLTKLGTRTLSSYTYVYNDINSVIQETEILNGTTTVKEYTYNKLNQLVSVKDFDGTVTTYAYDGAGNRIRQTADRTNTVAKTSPAALSDSIDSSNS